MGWQFKIYMGKLQAQEARFAELEGRIKAVQSDATAVSTKSFRQSGIRCAFICGLIAVSCTGKSVNIFKDLELKNSIYVRYAFSVDDCTLGVFL